MSKSGCGEKPQMMTLQLKKKCYEVAELLLISTLNSITTFKSYLVDL